MNRLPRALLAVLLGLALAAPARAADPAPPPAPEPEERPEYRARSLPTDTFKPSEQVSEDYAIPFPADI